MKIGIISDSHDNIWNLAKVLEELKDQQVEALIHCGDYCAPFVLKDLDQVGIPVHGIFGNVDGDRFLMAKLALTELEHITLHGETAELELGGRRIAVAHYPGIAEAFAQTGEYDLVAYGHTHEVDDRQVGGCRLINPGEVMGRKGTVSYVVLDTRTGAVEMHRL